MKSYQKIASAQRVASRWVTGASALYKRNPWELTLEDFLNPYPKPKAGYVSLYHYTKPSYVKGIIKSGLRMPFAHQNPAFSGVDTDKPLIHFQAPSTEVRGAAQGGTVVPMRRDVSASDILSVHLATWPNPGLMLNGVVRPKYRSDIGHWQGKELHRAYVEAALLTGLDVPSDVLRAYPKLKDRPDEPSSYKVWYGVSPKKVEALLGQGSATLHFAALKKQAEMTGEASIALMKWLSKATQKIGAARHVYVVGGAIRNFLIDKPIKDIDMVVDSLSLKGDRDAAWVARQIAKAIPTRTEIVTDALMVSKVFIKGPWTLDGHDLEGEVIEIVNARKEVYEQDADGKYLGHKPIRVDPTTLDVDVTRREFTFNTLMWRLLDLAKGPDKAEIIDLTGCGIRDLQNREMRCPQDPDKTFRQDPTRILRTIKFAFKYGFKLPPDVKAAARRQAKGLKRIPSKAWGSLRDIVLENPQYKKALQVMDDLGVIQVLREMVQESPVFSTTLSNYAKNRNIGFMFELMDLGIPIQAPIGFLDGSQQKRLREITTSMDRDVAWEFLEKLRNPGEAYKDRSFFPTLMKALGIKNGKILAAKLEPVARALLLSDPTLADRPAALRQRITENLKAGKNAGLKEPFPSFSERQQEQAGEAKQYSRVDYLKNKRKKLFEAKRRYKLKSKTFAFQIDKKRRNNPSNANKYKRRPPGATSVAERSKEYRERKKENDVRKRASFYYHQYSSGDYPNEGPEDKGLPSAYSPTLRFPDSEDDHPATKMNDIRSVGVDGGPKNVPSIERVRDRYASRVKGT